MQLSELIIALQGVFDAPVDCMLKWQAHSAHPFECHKFMEACCVSESWGLYVHESRKINFIRTCSYPYDHPYEDG